MNIHGYKQKIKEAKKKLALGINKIGYRKSKALERRIRIWRFNIQKLKKQRKLKKGK